MEYDFGFDSTPYSSDTESYVSSRKMLEKAEKEKAGKKKRTKNTSTDSHAFTDIPLSIALTSFTGF